MPLEDRILRLIAVGASVSANCQPCLQINLAKALESGADEHDIAQAIEVGRMVRKGAGSKMDALVASLNQANSVATGPSSEACGCETSR